MLRPIAIITGIHLAAIALLAACMERDVPANVAVDHPPAVDIETGR